MSQFFNMVFKSFMSNFVLWILDSTNDVILISLLMSLLINSIFWLISDSELSNSFDGIE